MFFKWLNIIRGILGKYIDYVFATYSHEWGHILYNLHTYFWLVEHKIIGWSHYNFFWDFNIFHPWSLISPEKSIWKCRNVPSFPVITFLKQCCIGKSLAILCDCILCSERTRALQSVDIIQILDQLITCCVFLGKSLLKSPLPCLRDGDNNED